MRLTCKKCKTVLEIPEEVTQTPELRVICPGCQTRYRLRPRKAVPAPAVQAKAAPTTASADRTPTNAASTHTVPSKVVQPGPTQTPTVRDPASHGQPTASPQPVAAARSPHPQSLTPATPLPTSAALSVDPADGETVVARRPAFAGLPVFADGEVLAGRYRVVRFLAQGGMGEVYEAEDLELRQNLALKTISAHLGGRDQAAVERFKREIALARSVTHPNVCRIFDLGQHQPASPEEGIAPPAVTFLTMELLQGETLADCLKRRGRLAVAEAGPLVEQMAAALRAAHAAQVVHRDFKSENVFLVPSDSLAAGPKRVVVTDFGVARGGESDHFASQVTGAGIVGTPAYMAPEQVEAGAITPATDIYSLGIVMYEMVTGRLPFEGPNPLTTAVKRLKEAPPPPHVHVPDLEAWWERAILRCLERDPMKRFANTDELVAALEPPSRRPPAPTASGHGGSFPAPTPLATAAAAAPQTAAPPPATGLPLGTAAGSPGAADVAPVATTVNPLTPPPKPTDTGRHRRSWGLGLVLLVVSLLSAALLTFNRSREVDRSRITPRRSVAVLGLKNLTDDANVAWLGTALQEMLTTELARGEALRTIPGENVAQMLRQLELDPSAGVSGADLAKARSLLGCDFLVSGSYVGLGEAARELRLDLRLQDAALGTTVASVARNGQQQNLFEMVAGLGAELRQHLGVDDAGSGDDPLAGLPEEPEAARLYSEALDKLRASQPRAAREMLEQAARLAPSNALVHSALSQAWESEGYGQRAAEAAARAFEHSSPLPREDRLAVEGRYREATGDWPAAVAVYQELSDYFPDDLDYGLRLVAAHNSGRDPKSALRTIDDLRRLPAPISEDPRIDLAEASAAGLDSDFNRQLAAARRAAERAQAIDAGLLVAQARLAESQAQRVLGQLEEAVDAARQAEDLYTQLDHTAGTVQAATALANVHFDRGEFDDAAERYRQVIDDYRRLGDQDGTASGLNNLAMVLKKRGDLDAAQNLYEEAAAIFEATDDDLAMTFALNNLGVLLVARDRLGQAATMFERARAVWEELGNRSGLAYSLNNIAAVRHLTGDLAESQALHQQALTIRRETGEKSGEAASLTNLAEVLRDTGEISQAERHLLRAIELTEEIGDRSARAQALYGLGRVRLVRGAMAEARAAHEEALGLRQELQESRQVLDSQVALARLALEEGDVAAAEVDSQMAVIACQRQDRPAEEARATTTLALALLAQDRVEASREAADGALHLAESSEQKAIHLAARIAAARVQAAQGEVAGALAALAEIEADSRAAGYVTAGLEANLAWAEIGLTSGHEWEARQKLVAISTEAAVRELGLLAAKAGKL
ncbi:MAG: tetratricopeptide repeat protein [Acidobacteriota bacterium]